jgi:hypothetical protein
MNRRQRHSVGGGTFFATHGCSSDRKPGSQAAVAPREPHPCMEATMGRGLLLWLIGIPLPIILLIWAFGGLS